MRYMKVIPRDLFDEAKLLKCLGKLVINAERANNVKVEWIDPLFSFDIQQNPSDGGLYVDSLTVRVNGSVVYVWSAYNSKDGWPLYASASLDGSAAVAVFDEEGDFTQEFLDLD